MNKTNRSYYQKPSLNYVELVGASPILNGSKTGMSIKVSEVTVEEYKSGFGDPTLGTDFQEISFE